jgi:hypothetical protein
MSAKHKRSRSRSQSDSNEDLGGSSSASEDSIVDFVVPEEKKSKKRSAVELATDARHEVSELRRNPIVADANLKWEVAVRKRKDLADLIVAADARVMTTKSQLQQARVDFGLVALESAEVLLQMAKHVTGGGFALFLPDTHLITHPREFLRHAMHKVRYAGKVSAICDGVIKLLSSKRFDWPNVDIRIEATDTPESGDAESSSPTVIRPVGDDSPEISYGLDDGWDNLCPGKYDVRTGRTKNIKIFTIAGEVSNANLVTVIGTWLVTHGVYEAEEVEKKRDGTTGYSVGKLPLMQLNM